VKGKKEGKGVLEEKNGVRYEGFFKQDMKHGPFVEIDNNGQTIRKGTYKYGKIETTSK
jgi:antitoxin component YwqK of YwqJK toxin-antitoxin module